MKGKAIGRGCAGLLSLVFFTMTFLPYLPMRRNIYGAVSFGQGELAYDGELVAVWDQLAEQEGMERTDFIGHMTKTYPDPETAVYKQQTSISPGGKWRDYQYRNMYCISHSRELLENPNMNLETTAVWYSKKEPYTLQNLPDFIKQNTADEYGRRLNFLIMAYAADYEAYQSGVNSDPVTGTADYFLCQAFCTSAEKAEFTGSRDHDWEVYRQCASGIAERYHPSALGSSQVYFDMKAGMERAFNLVWNTARLAADCVKSSDRGYLFQPVISQGEDGMYHARYLLTPETREFFASSSIVLYGDWNYEFSENFIDFKSQTGHMPSEGFLAEINLDNANGVIRRMVGEESVRELHMPVRLGNRWSLTFAQGNLVANLENGLRILVGSSSGGAPDIPFTELLSVTRYIHKECWQADYQVNLRKLDSETGEPLEGAWFDVLEAFDDRQLEGSLLEDDNWDNDGGSQFVRWEGWDAPYDGGKGKDPCEKDQEMTGADGWLTQMTSVGAGELCPTDTKAHRDTKYYAYTKGYCGGHPEPDEEDEEGWEEYERQIELCQKLEAAGGFYHSLDTSGRQRLEEDRDRHYEAFISLTYDYSARELAARKGYILHNQEQVHEPFEEIFDGIHRDTIPVETVTMHSSQYYAIEGKKNSCGALPEASLVSVSASEVQRVQGINSPAFFRDRYAVATGSDAWNEEGGNEDKGGETKEADPWILDEDQWDAEQEKETEEDGIIMPGMVRIAGTAEEEETYGKATASDLSLLPSGGKERQRKADRKQDVDDDEENGSDIRSRINFHDSAVTKIPLADSDYSGHEGQRWTFTIYDHRTEGEIHINKRDLSLKRGESEEYDSYGDVQGDGTLEGAVYGLFAADDIVHPDGRTGVVFEKGNLVAMAATDKNGDASFMAITEPPGMEYDDQSGGTKMTGFTGPVNLCEPINGNCWIGRPLIMGAYYVRELSRSEGYELSVYGVEAEISNRNYWQTEDIMKPKGKAWVEKVEGNTLKMEDTGKEETVTEVTLASENTDYGYDVFFTNIDLAAGPSFHLTAKGKKEVYREWKEAFTDYGPVQAEPGTQVVIRGRNVEAEAGDEFSLPNGEKVLIKQVKKAAITPERISVTGEKGAILTFDIQYIPELTGVRTDNEKVFTEDCNQAFKDIGLAGVGKDSPYWLVELGEDMSHWPQDLYSFLAAEERPAFNGAGLERIIRREGKSYAVLRYAFLSGQKSLPVAYSASDKTFYVRYSIDFWDGTEGYLYKGYPLSEIAEEDYEKGSRLYRWIRVINEKPTKKMVSWYEDLSALAYESAQKFRSYWVYGEGDFLRADDGSIYQKEQVRYQKRSGYETVETVRYTDLAADYEKESGAWHLHIDPEQIPAHGRLKISIRYQDRLARGQEGIAVAAVPSMNSAGTYVKSVALVYPGQYSVWEDAGTRKSPVEVWERAIVQKIKVTKETETQRDEAWGKTDNFRFKIYLLSNLTELFRAEDGSVVWQDRKGEEKTEAQVKEANRLFPEAVRKIYTKVCHRTAPLYLRSRDAAEANVRLYGYNEKGLINERQSGGYTALLETLTSQEEKEEIFEGEKKYNYEKFFDALAVANHDKWDDGRPTYTSWQPIGNKAGRSQAAVENARVSDHIRQFAVDWYLDDEVMKKKRGKTAYSDEFLDGALREAIIKAENYLKPFFSYDLDEIYAIAWDGEKGGGSDGEICTLAADRPQEGKQAEGNGYYGISTYLPYGTYIVVEQQPMYAGTEYEKNFNDFPNKHYQIDKPKVLTLPSAGEDYIYHAPLTKEEGERKYKLRFGSENQVIKAHNHQGDFEIYKYGLSVEQISNGVLASPGEGDYFALVQGEYKPQKSYYNERDDRREGSVDFYLTEGQTGREGVALDYRYSSVSEREGEKYVRGQQTACEGKYAPMLVPWSMAAPDEEEEWEEEKNDGESFVGFCHVSFYNPIFRTKLRVEKLDGETHENILHDGAVFALYSAKRDLSPEGEGRVLLYEKDTEVYGSREFLESMGASDIIAFTALEKDGVGASAGLYRGMIPAGTPICEESERVSMRKEGGEVIFRSYATVCENPEEKGEEQPEVFQTVGYWETLQPLKAGTYVICEEKAPYGYVKSRPVAVEIYSDKVTYYKEGNKDSRVLAVLYSEKNGDLKAENSDSGKGGENPKRLLTAGRARINIENEPIKLTVEKKKEASKSQANTTEDKTVSYKVSGRIDGSLADIGGNPNYVYAYQNGNYLGYAWKKGTLEYLSSRKAAGEQVEIVYEGDVFSGYGYVTKMLGTAEDDSPYVAGAKLALFDAIVLKSSGDTQDHRFEGLVVQRNSVNDVMRMYIREGYAGEYIQWERVGNVWQAVRKQRQDTDILYYDLSGLDMLAEEKIGGRRVLFGYDERYGKVPIERIESDKANFVKTDREHSLFAFKGGAPYLEFTGGDFAKLAYSAKDKIISVGQGTLVYHLDRDGNRDSLVDPHTGMAYVELPPGDDGSQTSEKTFNSVMVWPVFIHRDDYGNITARDKITTCRAATIGENEDDYEEKLTLEVKNYSDHEISAHERPSYHHEESGFLTGEWKSDDTGESHQKITVPSGNFGHNRDGEVLLDDHNGSFVKEMEAVYDAQGLPEYYEKSQKTYDKGTNLYDRNDDFVRYKDSDNLEQYNQNAYQIIPQSRMHDKEEDQKEQRKGKLYHRRGEGYILQNVWITSEKTPNDPFMDQPTDGQSDVLKRVPAGSYIMEELDSPKGYVKAMPAAVIVRETTAAQYASMVDKTTKVEIAKVDGIKNQEIQVMEVNGGKNKKEIGRTVEAIGRYTYNLVPGAEIALFKAKRVYSSQEEKGYYLEKNGDEPLIYDATDSKATAPKKLEARWITGEHPIYVEGIPEGDYILEEIRTPAGFAVSEPVEVEITNTQEVQSIIMYEDHTKIEVEKYVWDGKEKKLLSGAEFTLYEAVTDNSGQVMTNEGRPEYDPQKIVDMWTNSDINEYAGFVPAFETMYRNNGTKENTAVVWEESGRSHRASLVSSSQIDSSVSGGKATDYPTVAVLLFRTERGKDIRIYVYEEKGSRKGLDFTFEYQFDYRTLPIVNAHAVSYLTFDGVRRFDYLPSGEKYVLVETTVPEGYAKAEDQVIDVPEGKEVWRYSVENTKGHLIVSKVAEGEKNELAGACLELYKAGEEGELIRKEDFLAERWITGEDGTYTRQDWVNGRILPGYSAEDLKPHEIHGLPDGIYWLTEKESPDYYALSEPIRIDYRVEDELRIVRMTNKAVTGSINVRKTDKENHLLEGAVFELAAYEEGKGRAPVFTQTLSDMQGIIEARNLPVGRKEEDGHISPYFYKLREVRPPDGYAVNTELLTFRFAPQKDGVSYKTGETAVWQRSVVNEKTKVSFGKKDFDVLDMTGGLFLAGAEFAIYEITGRDEEDHLLYDEANPFAEWVTEERKAQEIEGLTAGHAYLLKEKKAPQGYQLMKPIIFSLSADGRKICGASNRLSTITANYAHDSIESITINGRYAVGTEYEMCDDSGNLAAWWRGSRDGHTLYRESGPEEGKLYTVTEKTRYSDGTEIVTGKRTALLHYDHQGSSYIPGREAKRTELRMEKEKGAVIASFYPDEVIREKTVFNPVLPENPCIVMQNRNGGTGDALDPVQMIFGTVTCMNTSDRVADMELEVRLDGIKTVTDLGTGKMLEDRLLYFVKGVRPGESRDMTFAFEADESELAVRAEVILRYEKNTIASVKEVPLRQENCLTVYHELTGSGKELFAGEESCFEIHLYTADGEELRGRYAYKGSKSGFLRSGDVISLAGNEFVTIAPGVYRGIRYQVRKKDENQETAEADIWGKTEESGSCAAFRRDIQDTSKRQVLQGGERYLLAETTVYSDETTEETNKLTVVLGEQASVFGIVAANRQTRIRLSKTDKTNGRELPGNRLLLKDKNGKEVASWLSGTEPYELKGILNAGETYVWEEQSPAGGFSQARDITFTVENEIGENLVVMENEPTCVKIAKIDADTQKPLSGALLQIKDSQGKVLEHWISQTDVYEVKGKLTAGETYYIEEERAPEGYEKGVAMEFQIPREPGEVKVYLENRKKRDGEERPENPIKPEEPEKTEESKRPEDTEKTEEPGNPGGYGGDRQNKTKAAEDLNGRKRTDKDRVLEEANQNRPGWVSAHYTAGRSLKGKDFFDGRTDMVLVLSPTGDNSLAMMYMAVMLMSFLGMAVIGLMRKRSEKM